MGEIEMVIAFKISTLLFIEKAASMIERLFQISTKSFYNIYCVESVLIKIQLYENQFYEKRKFAVTRKPSCCIFSFLF